MRKLRVFSPPPHMSSHPGFFAFVYFSSRITRFLCFFCETGDDSGRHSTLPPITLRPPYLWLLLEDYEVLVKMKMGTGDISLSPDHTFVSLFVQHATAPGRWRKNERIIRFFFGRRNSLSPLTHLHSNRTRIDTSCAENDRQQQ